MKEVKLRDLRQKEKYIVDDSYLNGYAKFCGWQATLVYNSLCRHANKDQYSFPSIKLMTEQHGVGRNTIIKGIKSLESWNIIAVNRLNHKSKIDRTNQGMWKANGYTLLDKSQWEPSPSKGQRPSPSQDTPSPSQEPDLVLLEDTKETHSKETHSKERGRFTPPSLEEVSLYCLERGNKIDAQGFIDFYASKGWLIGKNKMKDWRAAVRTWESRDKQNKSSILKGNLNKYDKFN